MKTKFIKQQENNSRRVSKLSFIPFGILLVFMSTSAFANDVTNKTIVTAETSPVLQKPAIVEDADTITISNSYKKTIEDVIKEDNLIIDSTISIEVYPLDFGKFFKSSSKRNKLKAQHSFSNNPSLKS